MRITNNKQETPPKDEFSLSELERRVQRKVRVPSSQHGVWREQVSGVIQKVPFGSSEYL